MPANGLDGSMLRYGARNLRNRSKSRKGYGPASTDIESLRVSSIASTSQSVLINVHSGSTQEAAYAILTEQWEERATKSDAKVVGALPSFVNKALKIEQIQCVSCSYLFTYLTCFLRRALHCKVQAAEISVATLSKERAQLRKSVTAFREMQIVICPALHNVIKYIPFHNPETEPLFLPSHFSKESRSTYCLDELAEIEFELRKGQAYDAIQDLKSSIQYMKGALRVKAKNSGSQKRNTRSTIYICKIRDNKDVWAAKYRRARECLLALGADPAHFRQLNDADMFLRNIRDDAALGEGSTDPGWIWSARWHRDETLDDAAAHEIESVLSCFVSLYALTIMTRPSC